MKRATQRALALVLCFLFRPALADGLGWPRADEATDYLSGVTMAAARPHWTSEPHEPGLAAAGFLFWPTVAVGTLFDSNPTQSAQAVSRAGAFVAPRVIAERDTGVHSTIGYAALDLSVFPGRTAVDRLEGRAGVLHDWAFSREILLRLQADFQRHLDPFDRIGTGSAQGDLVVRDDLRTTASWQQTWSTLFLLVSGEVLRSRLATDDRQAAGNRLSDSSVFSGAARVGTRIGPALLLFGEGAVNWRVLDDGPGSDGQRLVVGLGTDRLGLATGELFMGAQTQSTRGRGPAILGPVIGARIGWSPRPEWMLSLDADEHLGSATVGTIVDPLGTPTRDTEATLSARFAPSRSWTATASISVRSLSYIGTPRHDRLIVATAAIDYAWLPRVDLVASAEFADLASDVPSFSYVRAVGRLGATYSY